MKDNTSDYYFHAGVQFSDQQTGQTRVDWSDTTHRSKSVADNEALKMARKHGEGGNAVVEYWRKENGLRPGFDCAEGAYEVLSS